MRPSSGACAVERVGPRGREVIARQSCGGFRAIANLAWERDNRDPHSRDRWSRFARRKIHHRPGASRWQTDPEGNAVELEGPAARWPAAGSDACRRAKPGWSHAAFRPPGVASAGLRVRPRYATREAPCSLGEDEHEVDVDRLFRVSGFMRWIGAFPIFVDRPRPSLIKRCMGASWLRHSWSARIKCVALAASGDMRGMRQR